MEKLGRKSSCRLVALQFLLCPRGGGSCSRDGQSQGAHPSPPGLCDFYLSPLLRGNMKGSWFEQLLGCRWKDELSKQECSDEM